VNPLILVAVLCVAAAKANESDDTRHESSVRNGLYVPSLGVRQENLAPTYGTFTFVWVYVPEIPGCILDLLCYEHSNMQYKGHCVVRGGAIELRHRSTEDANVLLITTVTPEPGAVELVARAEIDAEQSPGAELPENLPEPNLCFRVKRAEDAFSAYPDPFPEFISRCFIFTKRGFTCLDKTTRRKMPRAADDDLRNNPPWVQIYTPVWQPVAKPSTGLTWYNASPDRFTVPVIGVVSRDGKHLVALANGSSDRMTQAWQECLHNNPIWLPKNAPPAGQRWRVKLYIMPNDSEALLTRVAEDFPNAPTHRPNFTVCLQTVRSGYDRKTCWVHTRAGMIPGLLGGAGDPFSVVMTMHALRLTGQDVYYPIHDMRSDDGGKTWSEPIEQRAGFARRPQPGGIEEGASDFWPTWHEQTGVLLGTGHSIRYTGDELQPHPRPKDTVYSVYDPENGRWAPFRKLETPDDKLFFMDGAGSTQRVDLENGEILLPTYSALPETATGQFIAQDISFVMRCKFDGKTLTYLEHGNTLTIPSGRGFAEPALVRFAGRFLMTLRNDDRNYVTTGEDGLHFDDPHPLKFDDGSELGSYNTQTHWLTLADRLYLVYTRSGANNDHVFRHRAPLFIGQFDLARLCVIRNTERILVPERGARLGNFGITKISDIESRVTVTEWMQTKGERWFDSTICEKYGSDNSIFVAKVRAN